MSRASQTCLAVALAILASGAAAAQEPPPPPTPEEIEKRARKAEEAPLFQSQEPLALTLATDISWLRSERPDVEEAEGTLTYVGEDGDSVSVPVKVRTRGNFRRDKANCNFPPLRLNFAGKEVKGTVFDGQDKLKLVTPCQDGRDLYQQYILQEYLVYRVYQLFSPVGYRVRLVHITYVDPDGGYDTRTKTGFLIEADDQMAERNRSVMADFERFLPNAMDDEQSARVALFQYMIGNTDFSSVFFHNAVMVQQGERFLIVPYDFDWSGVVDARYAVPDPSLGTRSVKERVFRGFCRPGVDHQSLIDEFTGRRADIWALYEGMTELDEGQRERALKYYEKFYEILGDPKKFEREVLRECLDMPR